MFSEIEKPSVLGDCGFGDRIPTGKGQVLLPSPGLPHVGLITLFDLINYSPIPFGWPLLETIVWVTLVLCVIAVAAPTLQLSGCLNTAGKSTLAN
jgi:hypothetical protein